MESPVVTINQGQLKGCFRTDIDGGKILCFLGIPYAKTPVGNLRFRAPVPAEAWSGVRDATKEGDRCYSRDLLTKAISGSEDCLNLNVFTKELPKTGQKLVPVMVWIHGGAFVSGSNSVDFYGPEFLLTENIVLVSINYRLGALGFLSSGDSSAPGNAGLKDQVLALRWVHDNIKSFNGDPENVTIFGESAGSGSVHYQVLSPLSKGLFHKSILQSGCALNHWALGTSSTIPLAKQFQQDISDEQAALKLLRSVPVEKLFEAQGKLKEDRKFNEPGHFCPVVEVPNETAFITKSPIDIIRSGNYNKVPLFIGYTSKEGMLVAVDLFSSSDKQEKKEPPTIESFISWQLELTPGSPTIQLVVKKLAEYYFKGPDHADNAYVLVTDGSFLAGIMASIKNHLETSKEPIFLYRMSLEAGLNTVKNFAKLHHIKGTCHGDDLGYLFKTVMTPEFHPDSLEGKSVRRFVKLWTNFAKYGNPTPDINELGVLWEPVEEGKINFLNIGEELTTETNPESERMALWKELFQLNPTTAVFL